MYLKISNAAIDIGNKRVLEEVNMEVKDKDHIAIVGRNGAGKSTLLKALVQPDLFSEGVGEEPFTFTLLGHPQIGYLKQNAGYDLEHTLLEEILEVYQPICLLEKKIQQLEEKINLNQARGEDVYQYTELQDSYGQMGGYAYQKEYLTALTKNGFTKNDLGRKMNSFSGGEQTKIAFIKLLLSKPDLLLLDEPTNHLAIDGLLWLEDYLQNYPKTFIVVSHDRMFIDHVVQKIYEIEYGETHLFLGNYTDYEQEKKKRYDLQLKNYENQQKEIARLQRIADRFRYKPSKARMAMAKLKQIERMVKVEAPVKENTRTFQLSFPHFVPSGKVVLSVDHLKFGYQHVLGEVTFTLAKGRRLAIIGPNGTGKSTLVKTLMGLLPPIDGNFSFGFHVSASYYDQQFSSLHPELTVYQEFSRDFPDYSHYDIRSALARFLFYDEDMEKKVEVLSGGEKARLELCKVVCRGANFLILDEPTNHLDIYAKEKLEEVLIDYPGTILFVSHDRYFIRKIADSILSFQDGQVVYYDYGYDDYLEKIKPQQVEKITFSKKSKKCQSPSSVHYEKKIRSIEEKLAILESQLFQEDVYCHPDKYHEIEKEKRKLERELDQILQQWERE